MKILLDANISWRIKENLKEWFEDCIHVDNCGLNAPVTDQQIQNFAKANQLVIFINDLDFINLGNLYGFPPKCVILRTGNQSTLFLERVIISKLKEINDFYSNESEGALEIY